jgi:hypothetical protein
MTTTAEVIEPVSPHFTITIQVSDRMRRTPITDFDIEEILALLGHAEPAIIAATIQVSESSASVYWAAGQPVHPTH